MNPKPIIDLKANGDLRGSANQKCETAQLAVDAALIKAIKLEGAPSSVRMLFAKRLDVVLLMLSNVEWKSSARFPAAAAVRRRGRLAPFEDRHSRKRVPSTTPRLFALRFEPANQNCA